MATPTALPTSFVSGQVLTAADQNLLRGAFRVLQVVSATTSIEVGNSTTTYADTGLTATITPLYNTSKILVLVSQNGVFKTGNTSVTIKAMRASADISVFAINSGLTSTAADNNVGGVSLCYLDSPATTSATIYKTRFFSAANIAAAIVQYASAMSTITLMEISA